MGMDNRVKTDYGVVGRQGGATGGNWDSSNRTTNK